LQGFERRQTLLHFNLLLNCIEQKRLVVWRFLIQRLLVPSVCTLGRDEEFVVCDDQFSAPGDLIAINRAEEIPILVGPRAETFDVILKNP